MNSQLKIQAHTSKVGVGTNDICSDEFISKQTIIVNALDNVEARRYMDSYVFFLNLIDKRKKNEATLLI